MISYIALIRGINVGGKNILPMRELVNILESIGFKNIRTYIQSGNVVFESERISTAKSAKEISAKILEIQGFAPSILLLELYQLQAAINNCPFSTADGKSLHFFFLESHPTNPDLEGLKAVKTKTEEFKLVKSVFYLYAPEGIGRSKLAAKVEHCLGVPATGRNWNTINKLLSMVKR